MRKLDVDDFLIGKHYILGRSDFFVDKRRKNSGFYGSFKFLLTRFD